MDALAAGTKQYTLMDCLVRYLAQHVERNHWITRAEALKKVASQGYPELRGYDRELIIKTNLFTIPQAKNLVNGGDGDGTKKRRVVVVRRKSDGWQDLCLL